MNSLNLSDNIIRLRHKKKITQEQLADFVGVTKASVSKWETRQSMPDVLLLPKIAAFFDVTVDELLGYKPQLSKEQIQKIYRDLATAFAKESFEDVMKKSQTLVKKYYSCYPFLFQIGILWLNHFMLASDSTRRTEVLTAILDLCCRIISDCKDIGLCEDAVILKASVCLQLERGDDVIETLEEILNPCRLSAQSDGILIQAYILAGEKDKADSFTQMSMFLNLVNLVSSATHYITIHSDNFSVCENTIQRVESMIAIYHMERIHPNTAVVFCYQAAMVYCMHGKKQEALNMLKRYTAGVDYLLTDENLALHGDNYFNRISEWYEQLDIGADAPRDKRVILDSAVQALSHPLFVILEKDDEFQKMKRILMKRGENL